MFLYTKQIIKNLVLNADDSYFFFQCSWNIFKLDREKLVFKKTNVY